MANSMLEADFLEPYNSWKTKPSPDANAKMLDTLHPVIEGAIRTHTGSTNPLIYSQARRLTLEGLRSYDPSRGRLQTHLYNHLQGLKRINRQQTTIIQVPERIAMERNALEQAEQELRNTLGREPTDDEISDQTGLSAKRLARVRSYNPGMAEGSLEDGTVFGGSATMGARSRGDIWQDVVYDELDPYHKKVMELTLGLNGRRPVSNNEIARILRRSPGAISQAKLRIQEMLNQDELLEGII